MDGTKRHADLPRDCGVCGLSLQVDEPVVALLEGTESKRPFMNTEIFLYPRIGGLALSVSDRASSLVSVDGWALRAAANPADNPDAPESVCIHHQCYQIFRRAAPLQSSLGRLWKAAAWRRPWRHCASLHLPEYPNNAPSTLKAVADKYGLPHLTKLPFEILLAIHAYSASSPFWAAAAALDIAASAQALPEEPIGYIPIESLQRWQRYGDSVLNRGQKRDCMIRLTIDARGIKQFERLSDSQVQSHSMRYDKLAFIVAYESQFRQTILQFQDHGCRLLLPEGHPGLQIWDTPSPPMIPPEVTRNPTYDECETSEPRVFFGGDIKPYSRFKTEHLSNITGITFVFDGMYLLHGLHFHTAEDPIALRYAYASQKAGAPSCTFVYTPLPPGEEILSIGLRGKGMMKYPGFVINTKLFGTYCIGRWYPEDSPILVLANKPEVLFYDVADGARAFVQSIGSYGSRFTGESQCSSLEQFPQWWPEKPCSRFSFPPFFSSAPLRDVIKATAFKRKGQTACRGILFEYKNGMQRAVGECRLGIDLYEFYHLPHRLCIRPGIISEEPFALAQAVEFPSQAKHTHSPHGYYCYEMRGVLRFWFTSREMYMEVVDA